MAGISTHILNAALGKPAAQVLVKLYQYTETTDQLIDQQFTDADGRIKSFAIETLSQGDYQLVFEIAGYFDALEVTSFYPKIRIDFKVADSGQHYHVPLLISPFSYSTYRGS